MKKTKFFTCIAMLGLVLSLGACEELGIELPQEETEDTESGENTDFEETSGEHTHSYEVTEHKDATCTEAGYDVYTCSCGDTYTETIDALRHDYQPTVTPPTCGEKGYTTYTCSRCGDSYTADETDPTGEHTPAGEYLSDETGHWQLCSDCGQVVGFEAHTAAEGYQSDETYRWQVCTTCGYEMNKTEHTFITDLSSIPAAGFGEEHDYTNNVDNPKSGVWTRGIFYYWNGQWDWGAQGSVSVSKAEYDNTTSSYVFTWTTDVDTAVPYAFQIFYTLPEDAGLEQGATYSLTLHLNADFTHYIEICGKAVYVEEGSNTITLSGLTATQYSDLSIQLGDNLYVDDGKCVQNGTIAITHLAFDYVKADVGEGESESHSYVVDFGSTTLNNETDVVGTISNHLGEFSYFYNFVSGSASISEEGLTFSYDKDESSVTNPEWSSVTLGYNLPADSGLSEGAGAGYQYTIRLTAEKDCTLLINEEEFEITGGVEFELNTHQSNYGGAASNVPTLLMYFGSRTNSTIVYPNTINITYLAFDF